MRTSFILKKIYGDGLLPKDGGTALDLGFGDGAETVGLADIGFVVEAVDSHPAAIARLEESLAVDGNANRTVHLHHARIEDFEIKPASYDCIVASNSIPFIQPKAEASAVIRRIVHGLKPSGCAYITVFGVNDAWAHRADMSFWTYADIVGLLESFDIHFYHSVIEEGFGKTIKGEIKYWNVFKFIVVNELPATQLLRAA